MTYVWGLYFRISSYPRLKYIKNRQVDAQMSKVDLEDAYNKENVQIHSKALVKRHGQE